MQTGIYIRVEVSRGEFSSKELTSCTDAQVSAFFDLKSRSQLEAWLMSLVRFIREAPADGSLPGVAGQWPEKHAP
jgi:hypothetical protein